MSKIRKIAAMSLMTGLTAVSLISSTYAFVVLNREATVEDFDFNVETDSGLLISVDGINFSQDITLNQMKQVIENNTGLPYNKVKYDGVTLSQTNGKINFDEDGYPIFVRDSLEEIANPVDDIKYNHTYKNANKNDYLQFDLYFKLINQGSDTATYNLYFKDTSGFESAGKVNVTLNNNITLVDGTSYLSGQTIELNPVDALRLGVANHTDKTFVVYEPSVGLGSAAIEGSEENIHNKGLSVMYNYYNALHPHEPFTKAAEDGEAFDTVNTFAGAKAGEFVYKNNEYSVIKLTLSIWLEGWDADFLAGLPVEATKFKVNLGFYIEK